MSSINASGGEGTLMEKMNLFEGMTRGHFDISGNLRFV